MQVIHIIPAIAEEASGPSYSVVRLCQSLIDAGMEVSLAALDWSELKKPPHFLSAFPLGIGPRRLGRSPSMYRWLSQQCNDSSVTVLHNHGMWQMNSLYPAWVTKNTPSILVNSPRGAMSSWAMRHGSLVKKIFWPLLQAPALHCTTCFHATAESEYDDIRSLGFKQPVAIIPNGIDLPAIPAAVRVSGKRKLLFLSRIHKKKGLENLLYAWAQVEQRYPHWELSIVGSDDGYYGVSGYLEYLKQLAQRLNIQSIQFLGQLTGDAKMDAYAQAEIFVLPTFSENFGMAVAEALASATPVIVTKGAPWSGVVDKGAGWWIDLGIEPLVDVLDHALSLTPEELSLKGMRGRLWMEQEFSWSIIGDRMAKTYRWLSDTSQPSPPWVKVD